MIKDQYIDGDYQVTEYVSGTIVRELIAPTEPVIEEPITISPIEQVQMDVSYLVLRDKGLI